MFVVLDTNHFRELRERSELGLRLQSKKSRRIVPTLSRASSPLHGRIGFVRRHQAGLDQLHGYERLHACLDSLHKLTVLPFDPEAALIPLSRTPAPARGHDGLENHRHLQRARRHGAEPQPGRFRKSARLACRELAGLSASRKEQLHRPPPLLFRPRESPKLSPVFMLATAELNLRQRGTSKLGNAAEIPVLCATRHPSLSPCALLRWRRHLRRSDRHAADFFPHEQRRDAVVETGSDRRRGSEGLRDCQGDAGQAAGGE